MAQRMAATKQKTPLNAIKMRRVTAKQPLGVHSKRANKLNVKDKPLNTYGLISMFAVSIMLLGVYEERVVIKSIFYSMILVKGYIYEWSQISNLLKGSQNNQ